MEHQTMKLLVVDDDVVVVDELCEFLGGYGYHCVAAYSGEEAFSSFTHDAAIGIILSDLHLPGLNGIQLMQELERIAGVERPFAPMKFWLP